MTFNVWTFLFEAMNFVVLAWVLHRLLYRPLHKAIDRRRDQVAKAQKEAEQSRQEAATLTQQLHVQLAGLEQQRQESIHQAREQAQAERKRLLADAEQVAQQRQLEVRQALDREREEAFRTLRGEIVGQAIDLTRRLLEEASGRSLDQQLALRLAETLRQLPAEQVQQVRNLWQPIDGAVLETAGGLDDESIRRLTEAAVAVVGGPVQLATQTRPGLLGGARLRLGGHVWDASLAGQLTSRVGPEGGG
jgi:F-type H+-transporting ATPase subunit b